MVGPGGTPKTGTGTWRAHLPQVGALLGTVLLVGSCGLGCEGKRRALVGPEVGAVLVVPGDTSIGVGQTVRLQAVLSDSAGKPVTGGTVTWKSGSPAVATVSSSGIVTGRAVGSAQITATAGDETGAATVTVTGGAGPAPPGLVVSYASYLGGGGVDVVRDIDTDAQGNIYVAGGTASSDFPTTAGAFDRSFNNPGSPYHDVFVMKLAPSGQIIWSTFIGGPNYDRAYAIEVDGQGNVYVAGRAGAGFPVTAGAFQTGFVGGASAEVYGEQDGFVCKLRPDGSALVWCSYFGNDDAAPIRDIALDGQGNVYAVASAAVGTFPAGWFTNAFQKTRRGGRDLVVAKIRSDGSQVEWATYLGGSGDESNTSSIRVGSDGTVYVMATTQSPDMPVPGGFDRSLGGQSDIYVAGLANDGTRVEFGTYLGGSNREFTETHELEITPQGNLVAAAKTLSPDFPTTAGVFQPQYAGTGSGGGGAGTNYPGDAFISILAADGSRLIASTFLGGREGDGAEGVGVDAQGNIYVAGATFSPDFPTTTDTLAGNFSSGDVLAAKLSPDLKQLLFSFRLGGQGEDFARTAHAERNGRFHVGGETASSNLPTTPTALRRSPGGSQDAFLLRAVPD